MPPTDIRYAVGQCSLGESGEHIADRAGLDDVMDEVAHAPTVSVLSLG